MALNIAIALIVVATGALFWLTRVRGSILWLAMMTPLASIIGSGKRTVTARCTEPCRVFAIPAAEMMAMFDADHTMGYLLMRTTMSF